MSKKTNPQHSARARRRFRVRKKVNGTAERPRLAVFRSNKHISCQVIDDVTGRTLAAASTYEKDLRADSGSKVGATAVGTLIGERAQAAGVTLAVFDRGGNKYHGRIAALADAAREAGLKF